MNSDLKHKLILVSVLGIVFLTTYQWSKAGHLSFLGVTIGGSQENPFLKDTKALVTQGDMVTGMVTPLVTPVTMPVTSAVTKSNPAIYNNTKQKQSSASIDQQVSPLAQASPVTPMTPLSSRSVVFNEIGWAGTPSAANDEWMELYNNTDSAISLSGWHLIAADKSPNLILTGTVGPHGYYLIERTSDMTISDVKANLVASFGKGSLNNAGEKLTLFDQSGRIQDEIDASKGWPGGDSVTKASMERINPSQGSDNSNWTTNDGVLENGHDSLGGFIRGTPGSANSVFR